MIRKRPLMRAPKVVHRAGRSGHSMCYATPMPSGGYSGEDLGGSVHSQNLEQRPASSWLPSPPGSPTPQGRRSLRRRWIVTCPKDCRCCRHLGRATSLEDPSPVNQVVDLPEVSQRPSTSPASPQHPDSQLRPDSDDSLPCGIASMPFPVSVFVRHQGADEIMPQPSDSAQTLVIQNPRPARPSMTVRGKPQQSHRTSLTPPQSPRASLIPPQSPRASVIPQQPHRASLLPQQQHRASVVPQQPYQASVMVGSTTVHILPAVSDVPPPPEDSAVPEWQSSNRKSLHRLRQSRVRAPLVFMTRTQQRRSLLLAAADKKDSELDVGYKRSSTLVSTSSNDLSDKMEAQPASSISLPLRSSSRAQMKNDLPSKASGASFDACVALAKRHGISLKEVRSCAEEFLELDTDGSNGLSPYEFEVAIIKRCNLPPGKELAENMRAAILRQADTDGDGMIGFEEFLLWTRQCNFMEEMAVTDRQERGLRQMAREHDLDLPHIDKLRETFNSCDTGGSGFIDWNGFNSVVCQMMKVKEATDISEAQVRRYWKEADTKNTGKLDFEAFVTWYSQRFYIRDKERRDVEEDGRHWRGS
eukprot:TRINITY_DN9075_c0_g1_i3.p1 TRINITY_DN9075_c0_g1~~TRINITY_DN9075_c0_g1_i3.p1  ORF type:complete len:586 (-),score=90.90 TRINITY_DN9075_c0_g1_i3:95-1852(-)